MTMAGCRAERSSALPSNASWPISPPVVLKSSSSIPARQLETVVIDHLTAALADPIAIAGSCGIELGSQDWRSIFGAGGDRPAIHRAGAVGLVR